MAFENVEASGSFEVEHDDRPFGRSHCETLSVLVEVDCREAGYHPGIIRQFR